MRLTNLQAFELALVPGNAETLERAALNEGNLALDGIAKNIKYTRNALYISVALTAFAATGVIFSDKENLGIQKSYTILTLVGSGFSTLLSWKLYNVTSNFQQIKNGLQANFF